MAYKAPSLPLVADENGSPPRFNKNSKLAYESFKYVERVGLGIESVANWYGLLTVGDNSRQERDFSFIVSLKTCVTIQMLDCGRTKFVREMAQIAACGARMYSGSNITIKAASSRKPAN